ncbi:MAG: hypothetical protein JWP20_1667 [Roseomonas sp.]|nr:hypothetical protein [Roseomonas sp.]
MALAPIGTPHSYGGEANLHESQSAVSWGAIIAGAFAAASISLILVALGSGLGLASVSPWAGAGSSGTTIGVMTLIWFIVMQWLSSGVGGYMAGRLRTKWAGIHTDEAFFRDTAHGFLAWALATVLTVGLLASAATSAIGTGVQAAASVGAGAVQGAVNAAGPAMAGGYDIDALFRRAQPDAASSSGDAQAEAGRIIANGISSGDVPEADRAYLAQMVAARAGISAADARGRVDTAITRAREAADQAKAAADSARKVASTISIFTALSMLVGAFIASAAAAFGGRLRDE